MKIFSIVLFLFLATSSFVFGQQTTASEQELVSLSTEWMVALERKDQAALERFLTEEFFISAPGDLNEVGRGEWLKNALEMDWQNLRFNNIKVGVYGETAVVTALLDFKVTTKSGIPISTNAQTTDIWVKRNGQWQVAARHLGKYSIEGYFKLAAGFIAGLVLCLMVWLLLKIKRRFAVRRKLAAS